MSRTTRTLGLVCALILAVIALVYAVMLNSALIAYGGFGNLTYGKGVLILLYIVICPMMVAIALQNAWHFIRLMRDPDRRTPRLLRPGLWLIAVIWGLVFVAGLFSGRHGSGAQGIVMFTLSYAVPSVLAQFCLGILPKRR